MTNPTADVVVALLARGDATVRQLDACVVRRVEALRRLLKRLPPTEGLLHVVRSNGDVVFTDPPPTVEEWNRHVDALPEGSFVSVDEGVATLVDLKGRVRMGGELVRSATNEFERLQAELDEQVNAFVARQDPSAPIEPANDDRFARLDTLAVLEHRRAALAAVGSLASRVAPSKADVYRMLLRRDVDAFAQLPAKADAITRQAAAHGELLESVRCVARDVDVDAAPCSNGDACDNAASNPWRIDRAASKRTLAQLKQQCAPVARQLASVAQKLRSLAALTAGLEYEVLMGSLGQKMDAYDRRIDKLLSSSSSNASDASEAERVGEERYDLQVRVVEPMLRRYTQHQEEQHQEHEQARRDASNETEYPEPPKPPKPPEAPDEVDETLWKELYWFGRQGAADLRRRREVYAATLTAFRRAKEEAAAELARVRWPHYVLTTLLAVQQHVVVAHAIENMLLPNKESRPPQRVDPQLLMDLLGGLAGTQYWQGTPRAEGAVVDCATFLLEWFQIGPTEQRYHEALVAGVAAASKNNAPSARRRFWTGAPLPTLREAAAALEPRVGRTRDLAALEKHASRGAALAASARRVGARA